MSKEKPKKKMGAPKKRPLSEQDFKDLDKMIKIHATLAEIAFFFGVSEDTIERRITEQYNETFAEYYKKTSQGGKMSLRRKQFELALAGNATMLIWLGKQYLKQNDKTQLSGDRENPIQLDANLVKQELEKVLNRKPKKEFK